MEVVGGEGVARGSGGEGSGGKELRAGGHERTVLGGSVGRGGGREEIQTLPRARRVRWGG